MTVLAALLGNVSTETFFANHYPARHLVAHGSLDRLPEIFYSGLLADPDALSDAHRGPVYVTNRGLGRHVMHGVEARECYADLGLTVGFSEVENLVPGVAELLRTLEMEFGMPPGCATLAVFVNGPGSGLSVHCDLQEQIVVQLRGDKTFRLAPHGTRFPRMKHQPGEPTPPEYLAQSTDGLLDVATLPDTAEIVRLRPGSMLFMPRGMYHETLAGDGIAMTAVFAFCQPTPAELVAKYLQRVLLQSEEWRRPLDFAWSPDAEDRAAAQHRMAGLLRNLASRIEHLSIDHVLRMAATGAPLDATTRLQRDPSTRVVVRDQGDRVRVEITLALGKGKTVATALPHALQPLLVWLADNRGSFTIAEACARFAEWDPAAITAAITALVRTKAVVEIPFEAL